MIEHHVVEEASQQIIECLDDMPPSDGISVLVSVLISLIAVEFPANGADVIKQIAASLPNFYETAAFAHKHGGLPM